MNLVAQRLSASEMTSSVHEIPASSSAVSSSSSWQVTSCTSSSTSVSQWVRDLRWYVEMECANVLHNKAVLQPQEGRGCCRAPGAAASARVAIKMLERKTLSVSAEFRKVFQNIHRSRLKSVHGSVGSLVALLVAVTQDLHLLMKTPSPDYLKTESRLKHSCMKLKEAASTFLVVNGHLPSLDPVQLYLTRSAEVFAELMEQVNLDLIGTLISGISVPLSGAGLCGALTDILKLALKSERFSQLILKAQGFCVLMRLCSDPSLKKYWPLALRAAASLCSSEEAVEDLEKHSGLLIVTRILADLQNSETMRAEAAGVIAQVTSPYLTQNSDLVGSLSGFTQDLIRALTRLSQEASSHDVFLLAAAAIANITFMSPSSFEYILRFNSIRVLVDACQMNKADSLFARDQVATVIANMASHCWCQSTITQHNGIELLLHFLSESPGSHGDALSRSACERLQQKAGVALSRLARQPMNAQIVIELQGLERLGELCRRPEERNNSDAVLVACLAALRQVHETVGPEDFSQKDLEDLVLPKLTESFNSCSKEDESYA